MFIEERIGEIIRQLSYLRYSDQTKIIDWEIAKTDKTINPKDMDQFIWSGLDDHASWGGDCAYYAFRTLIKTDVELSNLPLELHLKTGKEGEWDATNPQFSVFINGQRRQSFDVNHQSILLTESAREEEVFSVFLSAFSGVKNFHLLFDAELCVLNSKIERLYYDLLIPWQTACILDKDSDEYIFLINKLNAAVNLLDLRQVGSKSFTESIDQALDFLKSTFYSEQTRQNPTVICVGHTHIDIAWLWTLSVTKDKAVRSFSTVLELMDLYPEYKFMSSQPQLYLYVKEKDPELYEKIKQRVKEGRWEVEGSMFVEPDCNLSSGESLVRQILYGKKFFKEEFDQDNHILWLPDVFGYSAALPQIMKKSNIDYFMTTKISWNEVNQIPYDTFYWKGIDGTEVLTYFITTRDYISKTRSLKTNNEHTTQYSTNYNGYIHPAQIKGAWQRFQQKELSKTILCSFGYGDGGGGPTKEMLETQRRLSFGIPGCPGTKIDTAYHFFQALEKNLKNKQVPKWTGELYLEYHRATYTSMAKNKKNNRRAEFYLQNLENLAMNSQHLLGLEYPVKSIISLWEVLMRNQFHDILPGSSIKEVYQDSDIEYSALFKEGKHKIDSYEQALANALGEVTIFNFNGQMLSGFIEVEEADELQTCQKTYDGKYLIYVENIPPKGYAKLEEYYLEPSHMNISENKIDGPFYTIYFNDKGQIISWWDKKSNRELLQNGCKGNVLMTYEDKPHDFDNWNLYSYFVEKSWEIDDLISCEIIEEGPYRYAIQYTWKYLNSTIEEIIFFYGHSSKVDFLFKADWHEKQIFLKALFPFALNSTEATYEIQYGNVKRPTTYNTSWETAKFEVCHHKWLDISEGDYGVSILNDCKYGVNIKENIVGLSLIKSGMYPNPEADLGEHQAIYSVYPHRGSWQEAETVKEAYLLNNPMHLKKPQNEFTVQDLPDSYSPAICHSRNIILETHKKSEINSNEILRYYEFENKRTEMVVQLPSEAKEIWLCNLLEERKELINKNTMEFEYTILPFEIITFEIEY